MERRFSFYFVGLWTSLSLSGPSSFAQHAQRVQTLLLYVNWSSDLEGLQLTGCFSSGDQII